MKNKQTAWLVVASSETFVPMVSKARLSANGEQRKETAWKYKQPESVLLLCIFKPISLIFSVDWLVYIRALSMSNSIVCEEPTHTHTVAHSHINTSVSVSVSLSLASCFIQYTQMALFHSVSLSVSSVPRRLENTVIHNLFLFSLCFFHIYYTHFHKSKCVHDSIPNWSSSIHYWQRNTQ